MLPYSTAQVWQQLGLGSLERAALNGDLRNLTHGGIPPGTRLHAPAPLFPRADKDTTTRMSEQESTSASISVEGRTTIEAGAGQPTSVGIAASAHSAPAPSAEPVPTNTPDMPAAAPQSPEITIDDFAKIDLRVAQINIAERIPKADKLLRLEVDLGPEMGTRQILSGIAEWYTPEDLIGRRIAVISNLAPRKMRGLESHGMLLAASHGDNGKPILATFASETPLGARIR